MCDSADAESGQSEGPNFKEAAQTLLDLGTRTRAEIEAAVEKLVITNKALVGMVRRFLFDGLVQQGLEPVLARNSELGDIVKGIEETTDVILLPIRTRKEAMGVADENQGLAFALACRLNKGYWNHLIDDVKQEMFIYLYETALFWNPERGALSNYFFERGIGFRRFIEAGEGIVRIGTGTLQNIGKWRKLKREYPNTALESVSDETGIDSYKLLEWEYYTALHDYSRNPLKIDGIGKMLDEGPRTFDPDGYDAFDLFYRNIMDPQTLESMDPHDPIQGIDDSRMMLVMEKALPTLTQRQSQAVRDRYGLDDGEFKTFQETGERMGLTKQRVEQLEKKAFERLRGMPEIKRLMCR